MFGKSCENLFGRTDLKLVNNRRKALKLIAKPTYKHHTIFDENLVGVNLQVAKVRLNKPSYLGVAILDLSKTLMYDFHYNYNKQKYGDKATLLFTDTDSLCYKIETDDFYKDIAKDVPTTFDTSAYPKDHPSGLPRMNKKVIGLMKDEANGKQITEFVGIRAKCYAYNILNDKVDKKCKGVKKGVVKCDITLDDYRACVLQGKQKVIKQMAFRTREHNIFTEQLTKVALNPADDKRVIMEDGIHTLPIGHWRTLNRTE